MKKILSETVSNTVGIRKGIYQNFILCVCVCVCVCLCGRMGPRTLETCAETHSAQVSL